MEIKKIYVIDDEVLINIEEEKKLYTFGIPKEIYSYLVRTETLKDILVKTNKSGVTTIKIPSLKYKEYVDFDNLSESTISNLSIFKSPNHSINEFEGKQPLNINNNTKGVNQKMFKVNIKCLKREDGKKSYFENYINKTVKPKFYNKEFSSVDEIKDLLTSVISDIENENSKWIIEDNSKTEGFVLKNTYSKEGRDYSTHNICFVNVFEPTNKES